ncbi:hypothetical protein [Cellulomonas sp. B6]|uniref:hypothetical protein n=1 Tax=Cellulomonas sp. B6 TaxID=1295626 RepID=UPI00073AF66D|nr:hypothetical protein [Cellulomonas sp. B6]KSW28170.1 hypothetical protein ATM99_12255 [Cellulomonas sp. B6]
MSVAAESPDDAATSAHRAAALKERIYVAFTVLAVVITLQAHDAGTTPGRALGTLAIAVAATICTVYLADLLSHMVVHAHVPTAAEHRRMVVSTLGAGTVVAPALVSIAVAGTGLYPTSTGLLLAMATTTATLTAVGLLAVRRLAVPRRQRLVVMAGEVALGLLVLALGLLAHG